MATANQVSEHGSNKEQSIKEKLMEANLDKLQLENKKALLKMEVFEARAKAEAKMEDVLAKARTEAEKIIINARASAEVRKHDADALAEVKKHQAAAAAEVKKHEAEAEYATMTIKDEHMNKRRVSEVIYAGIEALTDKIIEKGDVNDLAKLMKLRGGDVSTAGINQDGSGGGGAAPAGNATAAAPVVNAPQPAVDKMDRFKDLGIPVTIRSIQLAVCYIWISKELEKEEMTRRGFITLMRTQYKTDVSSYFHSHGNPQLPIFILDDTSRAVRLNPEWFHKKVTMRLGHADWNCDIPESLTRRDD
ncbi:hypothetical protein JKP88DRAFT_315586 [Tribonema minus]|uniref:Uncharacterized protein n=1 Tax=Tribonema minus TaxID=303371 RepID=A0A835Z039_9STRA|nr:hypothetical protein JKP88DRAFT_315586 [Tribonema minus]